MFVSLVAASPTMNFLVLVLASLMTFAFAGVIQHDGVCGEHDPKDAVVKGKIVGGQETSYGEYPWVAGLQYKMNSNNQIVGFRCSGVLINKYYVLTTAECLKFEDYTLVKVLLGVREYSKIKTGDANIINTRDIDVQHPHPEYDPYTKMNNIALLKLKKAATFSDWIKPICLPKIDEGVPSDGTQLVVAGWGAKQKTGNPGDSDMKLKAEVSFLGYEECTKELPNVEVTAYRFCAEGTNNVGTCMGDNGGPLMLSFPSNIYSRWTIFGLISDATGCGQHQKVVMHTRVSSYMKWIEAILAS